MREDILWENLGKVQGVPQNMHYFVSFNFLPFLSASIGIMDLFSMPSSCSYKKCPSFNSKVLFCTRYCKTATMFQIEIEIILLYATLTWSDV